MPDPLDLLQDSPLPRLAPAGLIRARGEQRRRRAHRLLAAAGAGLVLLTGGSYLALTGGQSQVLQPAAPTQTPRPTDPGPSTPAPLPPSPTTTSGQGLLPPSAGAPSPRTSRSAPAPTSPPAGLVPGDVRIPATALLAAGQLGSSWQRTASSRTTPSDTCDLTPASGGTYLAYLSGSYLTMDGGTPAPETPTFGQEVARYPSPAAAQLAARRLSADPSACPIITDTLTTWSLTTVRTSPEVVRISYTSSGEPSPFSDYRGVVVAGDLVSRWSYQDPHGVTQAQAERAALLVRAAVCAAAGGC